MRQFPLNPRPPAAPVAPGVTPGADNVPAPAAQPAAPLAEAVPAATGGDQPAGAYVRSGGFHESSYELHHGLQISESEWSEDMLVSAPEDTLN